MRFSVYAWPSVILAGCATALAILAWKRRGIPSMRHFAVAMVASAAWSVFHIGQLSVPSLAGQMLFLKLQVTITITMPVLCLSICLRDTKMSPHATNRHLIVLGVIPALSMLLLWTDPWHHLFARTASLESLGPISALRVEPGAWFWVHAIYSYGAILATTLLLADRSRLPWRLGGIPAAILLAVPASATVCVGYRLGFLPFTGPDPTPLILNGTFMVLSWAVLRGQTIGLVPVARERVIDQMSEAIIVLDDLSRVVDINLAARDLLGNTRDDIVGQHADVVLPGQSTWQQLMQSARNGQETTHVAPNSAGRHLEASLIALRDSFGHPIGHLVTMRDVTAQRREALEREALLERMQSAAEQAHTLGNLLPICAWCGKVRDDTGYWQNLEHFVSQHSHADVRLGLCPDCAAAEESARRAAKHGGTPAAGTTDGR